MKFLKNKPRLSLLYDGKPMCENKLKVTSEECGNKLTTTYEFDDGLKITNIARKIDKFGAYEWVNWLENTSDKPTKLITELCDCDIEMPMEEETPRKWGGLNPCDGEKDTKVYAPSGSYCESKEFYCNVDEMLGCTRRGHIYTGEQNEYTTDTGRSCETEAPFFNIHKNGKGIIFAIGWTGKWRCILNRNADNVRIRTKVDDTAFKLLGGERVRTSSIVIMPYEGDVVKSQNLWRRLVKEEFSLVGSEGRDKYGPLCASIWGSMKSESTLKRIEAIRKNNIPIEYIWMDAGWYGEDTEPSSNEYEGDWWAHVGEWTPAKKIHPNGLVDVSKAIHDAGMKFLLWFEPERAVKSVPIVMEHPEYFLDSDNDDNLLLNLGNPEAWSYCFNTLSDIIEKMNIDFYRQDFNFDPIFYWRKNDWCDRKGMTEIRHINGLYRLWDALLERFPHLMIDNCAGGGRRIDIETLRRSISLWRSDAQCPADYPEYMSQVHDLTFNTWMPYSGTGTGRPYDLYRVRSSYGAALTVHYCYSESERDFCDNAEKLDFVRRISKEYLKVRPYFSEDFYPLTEPSESLEAWSAAQFDRPSENDGMIQAFRRENSPFPQAVFNLGGIKKEDIYTFTDIDTDKSVKISGRELLEKGFTVETEKRSAKIFLYSHTEEK